MAATTTATRKAKGREYQKQIAKQIQDRYNLPAEDVVSRSMGSGGIDIMLSAAARSRFPLAIEAKRQETISIMSWLEQAEENATKEQLIPAVVFKKNRSKSYICLEFEQFLKLVK